MFCVVFHKNSHQILLVKQCFATWSNGQTLFVKQISHVTQAMFDRLATSQNITHQAFFCSRQAETVFEVFQKHCQANSVCQTIFFDVTKWPNIVCKANLKQTFNNVWSFGHALSFINHTQQTYRFFSCLRWKFVRYGYACYSWEWRCCKNTRSCLVDCIAVYSIGCFVCWLYWCIDCIDTWGKRTWERIKGCWNLQRTEMI